MKKKILIIIVVIIIFICSLFLVANKLKKENNKENKGNDNQAKSYEVIDENAKEDYKTLLKIQYWKDVNIYIPEIEYKEIDYKYKVDLNKVVETVPAITYNNNEELKDIVEIIKNKFNIIIDNSWKYYIHYPSSDLSFGYITFTYYIDNIIATNKYISFIINNGVIEKISYAYLDKKINENEVLYRYNYFINHYKQEKGFVHDYEEYFTIAGEKTLLNYSNVNNKLCYTYNILYQYKGTDVINNDWGTELYIEPELIENLIKTKKMVVMDDNNKQVKVITDNDKLVKVTELLSRVIPSGEKSSDVYKFSLMLYDDEDNLIDRLYVDENGYIGFGNERNEYLKEKYYGVLVNYLE